MSPTYTMSAHLCKQIYKSFQTRQTSPEPLGTTGTTTTYASTYLRRSPSPVSEKRSMDSDRSDASAHTASTSTPTPTPTSTSSSPSSSWRWGGR